MITQNDWEGKERLIKKIEDDILMDFIEDEHGQFQYKGKYYSPKFGCDMLIWIVDGVYGLLADARREVIERIRNEFELQQAERYFGDNSFEAKYKRIKKIVYEELATLREEEGI